MASATASSQESDRGRIRLGSRKGRATSITVRLVALALVLVGGTTLTVSTLSYGRARTALAVAAEARLELLARDMAQALHRELTDRVADITTWAGLETMLALTFDDVDKQLADLMRAGLRGDDDWVGIVGRRADGAIVASAGTPPALGADVAPSGARLGVLPAASGAVMLRLDVPVPHPRSPGARIGTLVAFLDPARLLRRLAADRVGDDAVSVVLASTRPLARVGAVGSPLEDDVTSGVLATRADLPRLAGVAGPALHVVARQSEAVALAGVHALRATLIRIGLVVVLLSGLAGGLVAWRLAVPIRRLTVAVEEVTARGRPQPLMGLPRVGGEVGVLTDAFDSMLERLAASEREVIAQSRLALLGEVAASIAHDVRTPLSVLKTSAQLLSGPDLSEVEQRDLATMVASEVDRLNGVVTNLIDLAHPRASRPTRQTVETLVERAVAVLRPWARGRGVHIDTAGPGLLAVRVDADQMQQALLNVVHNAVQACAGAGAVEVCWRAQDDSALVEVTDAGPGFSPDALQRAFSPFFTTKSDGTGLGLAITRRIVEGNGGTVVAHNRREGGACVALTLPLAARSA
jgi:signal transduction histidine kinase